MVISLPCVTSFMLYYSQCFFYYCAYLLIYCVDISTESHTTKKRKESTDAQPPHLMSPMGDIKALLVSPSVSKQA